jgi:catechol 2,3-dioxygenase-like lactoylglutathione lyase family enzyme
MDIKSLHHVVYRCKDAKTTADFYTRILGLEYAMAVAEDRVPSTGEEHPYMHIFFRMEDGSYVAFFELPEQPPMGRDENTPKWVQHLALRVADEATLMRRKKELEGHGIEVLGPVDHTICKSIYFFDPNGHRLELAVDTMTPKMKQDLADVSGPMMEEWSRTKKAPHHADWVHKK